MLSADGRELASDDGASVEARVRRLVAETVGSTASAGPLLDAQLDSLTLIAIVTRIEAAFAIELDSDELVALLAARDWSELAGLVTRKLAAQHVNLGESARNDGC